MSTPLADTLIMRRLLMEIVFTSDPSEKLWTQWLQHSQELSTEHIIQSELTFFRK